MSDSELSEGMEELQELIAEYEAKTKEKAGVGKVKGAANPQKRIKEEKLNLEVPMDKVLFGDREGLLKNLAKAVGEEPAEEEEEESVNKIDVCDEGGVDTTATTTKRKAKKRKPVWTDADDEEIQVGEVKRETKHTGPLDHLRKDKSYKEYLTARFTRIVAQPKWASLERKAKTEDSDDEELLHTVGFLAKTAAVNVLPPHDIQAKRLKDLNRATYAEGSITSVRFHPSSSAALVTGVLGVATIYGIDGRQNEKLHSIHFHNFPIKCARITPCGTKAIFGSLKRFYYSYDLLAAKEMRFQLPRDIAAFNNFELSPCGRYMAVGRFSALHLFDARAHELLHSFHQESDIAGIRFIGDSRRIICNSKNSSSVAIYSLRQRRLEHSFIDDGCIRGRVLDLSPNQRLLATGSMEGVVNVYDFEQLQRQRAPRPLKSFLNLTTAISDVRFNHSSELLAMCSNEVPSAVRLAHFPSGTVYANFPGFKSDVGHTRCMEFSPGSGYLALGNRAKEVSLFRLKHFKNY